MRYPDEDSLRLASGETLMLPSTWLRVAGLCCLLVVLGVFVPGRSEESKGKRYALLVGVTEYKADQFATLKYPENDVEKLAELLEKGGFTTVRVLSNTRGKKDRADAP